MPCSSEVEQPDLKFQGEINGRWFDSSHGNKIQFTKVILKNHQVMEKTNIQRDIDAQEIKRIWQQLALGTAIAIIGLAIMGIGEMVCRWMERGF